MNPLKPRPLLRGKRVLLLFYEASTRTRSSFEIAAKSLGAMTTLVLSSGSSIEKGESLLDTGYTLRAVGADVIVIRHPQAGRGGADGAVSRYSRHQRRATACTSILRRRCSMPTRSCATRRRSRDCRWPSWATFITAAWRAPPFTCSASLGRSITLCGPPEFLPETALSLAPGLHITRTVEDAVHGADVVMMLRVQKERLAGTKISLQDYIARYQMTMARLKLAKKDAMLMHPGPDHSRAGVDLGSGGLSAVGDCRRSAERSAGAHGDSGKGAGKSAMKSTSPRDTRHREILQVHMVRVLRDSCPW